MSGLRRTESTASPLDGVQPGAALISVSIVADSAVKKELHAGKGPIVPSMKNIELGLQRVSDATIQGGAEEFTRVFGCHRTEFIARICWSGCKNCHHVALHAPYHLHWQL